MVTMEFSFSKNVSQVNLLTPQNDFMYLFFPIYKKSYTEEEERSQIINNHNHFTEGVSVVAMQGVGSLDTVASLNHGIHTTIHKLLLSVPAQGTTSGKLFIQVERQANSAWLLCCFHTINASKVTLCLGQLELLLRKYIKQDDHGNLFDLSGHLHFCGQVTPISEGKPHLPRYESSGTYPILCKQVTKKATFCHAKVPSYRTLSGMCSRVGPSSTSTH
jgi:hypothetical protein